MGESPLQQLLLQIALILVAARVCGRLMRVIGQPQVVGEMIAGILLGPSLLGRFYEGQLLEVLFSASSRPNLEIFAQIGVILFMFIVGLEVDLERVVRKGKGVFLTAGSTMVVPFLLGLGLAPVLLKWGYGPGEQGTQLGFILFMATAMSITAFPVLARILNELNMHRTPTGMMSIACAALNDVGGWCLLAVVLALAKAGGGPMGVMQSAGITVGLTALYTAGMIVLVRPVLGRLQALFEARGYLTGDILGIGFVLLILSAFITDRIGIHALFGAFLLGTVMPSEPKFVEHLTHKLEDLATLFLLPLFFAYTGLNTNSGLIEGSAGWLAAGLITLVATVGKVGGTMLAARWTELSPRHTLTLGVLMNTRGLMELVILNVALSVHAIDARVFSMMVIMTLLTTMMTTPLVKLLYTKEERRAEFSEGAAGEGDGPGAARVLVSVAHPDRVAGLLRIGAMLLGRSEEGRMVALHIDRAEDHEHRAEQADPLTVATAEARKLAAEFPMKPLQTVSLISERIHDEIVDLAKQRKVSWIVMGWHKPILDHSVLGGTAGAVMKEAENGVAVYIDKGLETVKRVLVPYLGDQQDTGVLVAADLLSRHAGVEVTILHLVSAERKKASPLGVTEMVESQVGASGKRVGNVRMQVMESGSPIDKVVEESHRYDLLVLGLSPEWRWGEGGVSWLTAKQESVAQQSMCSLLIVRGSTTGAAVAGGAMAGESLGTAGTARLGKLGNLYTA